MDTPLDPFKPRNTLQRSPPSSSRQNAPSMLPVASSSRIVVDQPVHRAQPSRPPVNSETNAELQAAKQQTEEAVLAKDAAEQELAEMGAIMDRYESFMVGAQKMQGIAELEIERESLEGEWRLAWATQDAFKDQAALVFLQADLARMKLQEERQLSEISRFKLELEKLHSEIEELEEKTETTTEQTKELKILQESLTAAKLANTVLLTEKDETIATLRDKSQKDKEAIATSSKEIKDLTKKLSQADKEQSKLSKKIERLEEENANLLAEKQRAPKQEAIAHAINKLEETHRKEVADLEERIQSLKDDAKAKDGIIKDKTKETQAVKFMLQELMQANAKPGSSGVLPESRNATAEPEIQQDESSDDSETATSNTKKSSTNKQAKKAAPKKTATKQTGAEKPNRKPKLKLAAAPKEPSDTEEPLVKTRGRTTRRQSAIIETPVQPAESNVEEQVDDADADLPLRKSRKASALSKRKQSPPPVEQSEDDDIIVHEQPEKKVDKRKAADEQPPERPPPQPTLTVQPASDQAIEIVSRPKKKIKLGGTKDHSAAARLAGDGFLGLVLSPIRGKS